MKPTQRFLCALAALALLAVPLLAQQGSLRCFDAQTATGANDPVNVCKGKDLNCPSGHTVVVVVSGTISTCKVELLGSIDGTNFFELSSTDDTTEGDCTASLMWHTVNKRVRWIKTNLATFSGSSSPTATTCYLGGL